MAARLTKPYLGTPSKVFIQRLDNGEWVEGNSTFKPIDNLPIADTEDKWWNPVHQELHFEGEIKCAKEVRDALIRAISPMQNLLKVVRDGKRVLGNKLHFEMSYDMYRYIQHICHRDFGCNLKRFFKENHIKVKVRYKTKNGYWVWMK